MEEHMTFKELAEMLGFKRAYRIYDWDSGDFLPTMIAADGTKCVTIEFAQKLADLWSKSCTPAKAAEMLGISPRGGTIGHLMDKDILKKVYLFGENVKGHTRVLLESIPSAKKYVEEAEERRIRFGHTFTHSGKGHRFTKEEARAAGALAINRHRFTKEESSVSNAVGGSKRGGKTTQIIRRKKNQIDSIPKLLALYIPKTLEQLEIVGDKKLVTPQSAADFLGITLIKLENLGLRGEYVDGVLLPYAHAVRVHKDKQEKVKEKPAVKGRR